MDNDKIQQLIFGQFLILNFLFFITKIFRVITNGC